MYNSARFITFTISSVKLRKYFVEIASPSCHVRKTQIRNLWSDPAYSLIFVAFRRLRQENNSVSFAEQ